MYHLSLKSSNEKTGPIPVSTTSADTCPPACPFQGSGCYAQSGPLAWHWGAVTNGKRGESFRKFTLQIEGLPDGQLWRHNQAGDLPGKGNRINPAQLRALVAANEGKRGFTYTHKPLTPTNIKLIREANESGFTVNLSGNSVSHAVELMRHDLPVVTVLPIDAPKHQVVAGHKVIACPATYRDVTCADCGLCQKRDRSYIIGFPAHGTSAKKADIIARG